MTKKPTYEELEQRVRELEEESLERKQVEDALRESEERLSSFMNSASDSMYLLDSDLNFVEVNKRGSEIIGKKREEIVGKNITDIVPNIKESGRYEQHLEVIKTGQPFEIDDFVPHPIFGDLHFILKSFKVSDGLGVIASEITGRRRAEEAFRESEELFSKAFHSNPNPLLISTLTDGRCIDVNEGFLRALGYSREEVVGRTSSELMFWVDPNDRLKVTQALEQGKRAMLSEVKVRSKSAEIRIMMFAADKIELGGEECLITTANDITERVKAEEDLHKYERIVAASNDHMSLIDKNYVYQVVNDAYLRSHNIKREDIVGHSVPDLFGQEFFETHQKPMIDRCLAGEVARYQSWIDFPTLGRRYMVIAHYPYFEDDGSISGYVVNAHDITERKQAEEALRKSEERLTAFMESATDGFILFDSGLNHIEMNKVALEITGLERKDVIGKNIIDTVPNIKETGRYDEYKKVMKTGVPFHIPDLISHPLTGDKHIELRAFKVGDGLGIIFTDVTERKQAEEELQKLASVVKYSSELINLATLDGKMIFLNKAGSEMLGIDSDKVEQVNIMEVIPDDLREIVQTELLPALIEGNTWEGELKYRNIKTGELRDVHAMTFTVKEPNTKKPLFLANVSIDITERKRAEEEKAKLEAQLQQAQKMEAIGTLAGGIAHDFNNIIGIILGNTELSMYDVPEWNPARLNLEEIRTASLRAKDVVQQLLSFARKTKLEKKPTNIIPIIKESLKLLRSSIPTSIEIRQNIPEDIDTILADPTQINQVLINLCTNADHAMPDGGVITVTLKKIELDADTAAKHPELNPGRYVNLTISDTGHGISHKEIDRIFDPYFTTKDLGKGTGMGLAVVHGIVEGHNGIIAVESELEKGTTFSIIFPVVAKGAVLETETGEKLPTGDERILFIDDEESIVGIGHQLLERLGYKVESTTSPIDALELFRSKPDQFDLVITDMAMPKMTGDKLVKEILKIQPGIPIILCTGFSEKIDEKKAKEMGVADYIEKPLDMRDYAMKIRKVLDVE